MPLLVNLTDWQWFSVVCTVIDKGICHFIAQNVVDLRGCRQVSLHQISTSVMTILLLTIRVQTMLNHCRFVSYNIDILHCTPIFMISG